MHVCMYVCMYVCVYVWMYGCMDVCVYGNSLQNNIIVIYGHHHKGASKRGDNDSPNLDAAYIYPFLFLYIYI